MFILAIDPGPVESAFVLYDSTEKTIFRRGKQSNECVRQAIYDGFVCAKCVIERIASYGKPVGEEVFGTVLWAGRFAEAWDRRYGRRELGTLAHLICRRTVKMHLCGSNNAKDAHVRQRLIDLFGPGKDKAIGKKKTPGPLWGIRADEWQALALAVTFAETYNSAEAGGKK